MRKIMILFLVTIFSFSIVNAGMIYVPANSTDNAKSGKASVVNVFGQLDAKTFLSLTPAKVQEMTGTKLTLGQKVSLKIAQMQVKRQLKKGQDVNMVEMAKKAGDGSFNWGAAALGFFLGLIGVLIVYLAFKNNKEAARKAAWIGLAVWVAVLIILLVSGVKLN
jgi:steroid 5-alpha reductase family enzyme